jgi:hypothetical protein
MSITRERYRPARRYLYPAGIVLLLIFAALAYLWRVPTDPPGFYIDESSICYNAHTISETGRDEYGVRWPLFFRAFGEYKNPTLIYLLALIFKATGPSIVAARVCTAAFGFFTGTLMGLLAWRMSNRFLVAAVFSIAAWLTPWLFEASRVVLEVALYPSLVVLFLLATWRASSKTGWKWSQVVSLAITLALLTYSYSIGRLLGPLLALGLVLLIRPGRWRGLVAVWAAYGALLTPILVFQERHPGALTSRFLDLTYLTSNKSVWGLVVEFIRRYGHDTNPARWLFTGGTDVRDHVPETGTLLAVTVLLGVAGLYLVLRDHRRDPWWRFILYALVVSVVPAALTVNEFPQLRLVAFPVFFLVLMIPPIQWLIPAPESAVNRWGMRRVLFFACVMMITVQGIYFQWLYHQSAPTFWYVFDARFLRKVLAPALATRSKPLYLVDQPGKSGYIQPLWYGALAHLAPEYFARVPPGMPVPPGSVAVSTQEECDNCRLLARSLNYIVYAVPPYRETSTEPKTPLNVFHAAITGRLPSEVRAGQVLVIDLLVKNRSTVEWPGVGEADGRFAVRAGARWRSKSGFVLDNYDSKRLPYDIEPNDTFGLSLNVSAPAEPGEYSLEIDLIQEGVGFFAEHGAEPLRATVQVIPSR